MINLVLFGGLSECGKTHASKLSEKNGFSHVKIIYFEKKIMPLFNIDPDSKEYCPFERLYDREHKLVYEKFWNEIKIYCKENNINNIALDSTTRKDMVDFFLELSDVNFISVYIEADFNKRVEREFNKLKKEVPFSIIEEQTRIKDETKLKRKADLVKESSIVITNNSELEVFESKIVNLLSKLKNEI